MKPAFKILLLTLTSAVLFIQCKKDDFISILDESFLNALFESGIDTDGDGQISQSEAEAVVSLDVSGNSISTMAGIEHFVNLDSLDCSYNQIGRLYISENLSLRYLDCRGNRLSRLDVSNNTALTFLSCGGNSLTSLDVTNNTALNYLSCGWNQLTSLDLSITLPWSIWSV